MKIIFFFLLLFVVSERGQGQAGVYVPPKVPDKYCKALDAAVLDAAAGKFTIAEAEINALIARYPTWTAPRHSLSKIQFEYGRKADAIKTMEAAIAIDTASQIEQLYTLGRLYEDIGDFDNAIQTYEQVLEKSADDSILDRARKNLGKLEKKLGSLTERYSILLTPLPEGISSMDDEALGRWTADGRALIFTRLVGGQEDLFAGYFNEQDDLIKVEEVSFNTPLNEGGHTISPDGKYLVFTACDRRDGMGSCDLYLTVFRDSQWTEPINMGPGFNSPSWESQPVFGLDGRSIYFASTRPGGFGARDIWMVYEIRTGKWSSPVNLGPTINTIQNESSPFIHFDGRTMYFMRDGEEGIGGYDLYFTRLGIDGKWLEPENMRYPINSGVDEGALAVHPDGRRALITRVTPDRKNELFEFILPDEFQSSPVQVLSATIRDKDTQQPVRGKLEIFDVIQGDTVRISQFSDEAGEITVVLDRNKEYAMIASAKNYLMHSSNLPADTASDRKIIIEMIPLATADNKPVALNNIFFETASARLLPSSNPELKKLLSTLRDHPDMHIEIRGHTDNVGMDDYNLALSEERAKAVYQYLADRGIEVSRLAYKGYGETQPVASNETEDGRRKNRRTEFVVVRN